MIQYTITLQDNGAVEISLVGGIQQAQKPRTKIIYNTRDIIYLNDGEVVCVVDSKGLVKYGARDIELDAIDVPKLSAEARSYLTKQYILKELEQDPHCYDEWVKKMIMGWDENKDKMSVNIVKRFFNIEEKKEDPMITKIYRMKP